MVCVKRGDRSYETYYRRVKRKKERREKDRELR